MTLNALSIIFSVLALIMSAVVAQRQLGAARNSDFTAVLLELIKEYRSPEMVGARTKVLSELDPSNFDPSLGFRGLPDDMRLSAQRISHFFDQVGLLVSHDLAPKNALISFFGMGAIQLWQKLDKYVAAERALRDSPRYQIYFEIFVDQSIMANPEDLLMKIQRRMNSSKRSSGWRQLRTRIRGRVVPNGPLESLTGVSQVDGRGPNQGAQSGHPSEP